MPLFFARSSAVASFADGDLLSEAADSLHYEFIGDNYQNYNDGEIYIKLGLINSVGQL
ncbi:hypothetical protein GCM10007905_20470 [Mixta theicola]|nr:hypothetical protein GCM10007905_20470 [Mixta theicola]